MIRHDGRLRKEAQASTVVIVSHQIWCKRGHSDWTADSDHPKWKTGTRKANGDGNHGNVLSRIALEGARLSLRGGEAGWPFSPD